MPQKLISSIAMNSSLNMSGEITTYKSLVEFQDLQPLHCQKDALTDFFGKS